jgi:hypothetical protein
MFIGEGNDLCKIGNVPISKPSEDGEESKGDGQVNGETKKPQSHSNTGNMAKQ